MPDLAKRWIIKNSACTKSVVSTQDSTHKRVYRDRNARLSRTAAQPRCKHLAMTEKATPIVIARVLAPVAISIYKLVHSREFLHRRAESTRPTARGRSTVVGHDHWACRPRKRQAVQTNKFVRTR